MKSKIVALSKNEEFKSLLKQKKISNKYVTIYFGNLKNKDNRKINISFVTKKKKAWIQIKDENQGWSKAYQKEKRQEKKAFNCFFKNEKKREKIIFS